MPWAYIARCADGTLYTGVTTDLIRRERQHNGELSGGAKYTRSRRPITIVRYIHFDSYADALSEERRIKKLTRAEKEALIARDHTPGSSVDEGDPHPR